MPHIQRARFRQKLSKKSSLTQCLSALCGSNRRYRTIGLVLALALALWPGWAAAECGPLDVGGCVDGAMYSFWEGIAGLGWWLDRTLLMGAYQIDTLRWWLVEIAFTSAYQALVATLSPMLAPLAILAVMIGCLCFLLLPLTGRTNIVNIRHALLWALLAPALMTISGPLIVQLEQARSQVGTTLYTAVSGIAPGAIFGVAGSDMRTPAVLYPASPCGVALTRRGGVGLRLDDLAAALVWADAGDIHCPETRGPGRDIPDAFYEAAPSGAGYAVDSDVSLLPAGNPRTEAVKGIQRGAIRTFIAIIPTGLAVLDALVQLLFALCLVALWVSLPIGLLFVFFQQSSSTVTSLVWRMLKVLQVSWASSVLTGLIVACLVAAAELRNAAAYSGFALGGGALVLYLLRVAADTFIDSLRTLSATTATVTGLAPAAALASMTSSVGSVANAGAAVVVGGAAAGLVAATAYRQTGSGQYAAATAFGRMQPLAAAGEIAAGLGLIEFEGELATGLYAGSRSERSFRMAARQIRTDAKRTDADGLTMQDRAVERQIERRLGANRRPTVVEELSTSVAAGRRAYDYLGSAQMAEAVGQLGERIPTGETVSLGWERMRSEWQSIQQDVSRVSDNSTNPVRLAAATAQVIDGRLRPGGGGQIVQLDARGRVSYGDAPTQPPEHALQIESVQANIPRLLTMGYVVQEQGDQIILWKREPQSTPAPVSSPRRSRRQTVAAAQTNETPERGDTPSAESERAQLIRAGALIAAAASHPGVPNTVASQAIVPASATPGVPNPVAAIPTPDQPARLSQPPQQSASHKVKQPVQMPKTSPDLPTQRQASILDAHPHPETDATQTTNAAALDQRRTQLEAELAATQARIHALQQHSQPTDRITRTPLLHTQRDLEALKQREQTIQAQLAAVPIRETKHEA